MAVFVRTDEGQDAAYSPQSALPRKLKSILKVIDGRTTMATFEQTLSSFGDVESILRSLEMAGLIRLITSDAGLPPAPLEQRSDPSPGFAAPAAPTPSAAPAQIPGMTRPAPWAAAKSLFAGQSGSSNSQAWQASELATHVMPANRHPNNPALQDTLDSMANFVLTHLPGQSFQILKEIEEITSMELLAVTLGGYEQMVASVGEASVLHVRGIKQALRENL